MFYTYIQFLIQILYQTNTRTLFIPDAKDHNSIEHTYCLCDAKHNTFLGLFAYFHNIARIHDRSYLLQHCDIIHSTSTQIASHASETLISSHQSSSVIAWCIDDVNINGSVTCDQLLNLAQANTQAKCYALLPVSLPNGDFRDLPCQDM